GALMTTFPTTSPAIDRSRGRALLWLGLCLCLLGPALVVAQFSLKRLAVPWYSPALATLGACLLLASLVRRRTVVRFLALLLVVGSVDDLEAAKKTKADFPHLVVVCDEKHELVEAVEAVHAGVGPDGRDVAVPTTLLIDGSGTVRWAFRPDGVLERLSPAEVLAAIDRHVPAE